MKASSKQSQSKEAKSKKAGQWKSGEGSAKKLDPVLPASKSSAGRAVYEEAV
jgi:hypothetical protein